ncbi:MAG TPA: DNA mismatch repair endonuclease MutL [Candidatus Brocadiia bacterium]|nr:DNA mismatch repair endonuclease MutL [Candidatus Brocadiia bacterium]
MTIKVLSEDVANKIAAGEVIERPASVVKELVENSLDAGAKRVEIELEQGGADLVRVVDDGCGMSRNDLALAFLSHATSKLTTADDLFSVTTLGFRGEALPSIGAVSRARIASRQAGNDEGGEIECAGGELSAVKVCGIPPGTMAEAHDLFFNVPARRKFLRSSPTELSYISEIVTRVALSRPGVSFLLRHNGREIFNLPASEVIEQRIEAFFGREISENMIPITSAGEDMNVRGFILPPGVDRARNRMQFAFVNGRYVRDVSISHAIAEAYRGLMAPKRHPVVFLFIDILPELVDVNVHPTKIEVRFRNRQAIHQRVQRAIRNALRESHHVPAAVASTTGHEPVMQSHVSVEPSTGGFEESRRESVRKALEGFFESHSPRESGPPPRYVHPAPQGADQTVNTSPPITKAHAQAATVRIQPSGADAQSAQGPRFFQIHDSYIVEETPDGVNIIDQHALHECLLYHEIRKRLREAPLMSQRLLVPEVVELTQAEFLAVQGLKEEFEKLGFELDDFGASSIVIRAFPQMLDQFAGARMFRDLLAQVADAEGSSSVADIADQLIKALACKGAVKAGQRLSPPQMKALLERRDRADYSRRCPHGRPTTFSLGLRDLQKEFERSG